MVSNVSSGMILAYENYHGKKKVTLAEMFKRLSLEMGGDGTKITKKQLDDYIKKAESGLVSISKSKLKALKKMQEHWDNISSDGENITFDDIKNFPMLLIDIAVGDFEESDKEKKQNELSDLEDSKFDIKTYLKTALNKSDDSEITKSDLEAQLQTLLSESSNDETSSELVDSLTNLIASFNSVSTINEEA